MAAINPTALLPIMPLATPTAAATPVTAQMIAMPLVLNTAPTVAASAAAVKETANGTTAAAQAAGNAAVATASVSLQPAAKQGISTSPVVATAQTVSSCPADGRFPLSCGKPETSHGKTVISEGDDVLTLRGPDTPQLVPKTLSPRPPKMTICKKGGTKDTSGVKVRRTPSKADDRHRTGGANRSARSGVKRGIHELPKEAPAGAPASKTVPVPVTAKPQIIRGAAQTQTTKFIKPALNPKTAALGMFGTARIAVEKGQAKTGPVGARTEISGGAFEKRPGRTALSGRTTGSDFVSGTLKPNSHFVIEAKFGGVAVLGHFAVRKGKLEFAGWEAAAPTGISSVALAAPTAITWSNIEAGRHNVFAFGLPGGETALKQGYIADVNAQVGAELANRIIAQIKSGPETLDNSIQLASLNAFMRGNGYITPSSKVTSKDWGLLVRETFRLALRHVPAIDGKGARRVPSIRADAARVLGIDQKTVDAWEGHFGLDFVEAQLGARDEFQTGSTVSLGFTQSLVLALEERLGTIAAEKIALSRSEFGVRQDEETAFAWMAARLSLIKGGTAKVERARAYLLDIFEGRGTGHAATAFAMIVWNSALGDEKDSKDAVAPRWSREDAAALVKALSNSTAWGAVSHRAFRGRLPVEANAWVNESLASARATLHDDVLDIDVTQVGIDAFFDAIEASGRADEITLAALLKMGLMAAETHKGAASREAYP